MLGGVSIGGVNDFGCDDKGDGDLRDGFASGSSNCREGGVVRAVL